MHAHDSIVYAAGPDWARDDGYRKARTLARTTGSTLAVLSDLDPGGPRPAAIRRGLPENASLVVRVVDPRRSGPGSTEARAWLEALPCSVWLVPEGGRERGRMVVAALELADERSDAMDVEVLRVASAVALAEGARLVALHAWSLIGEAIVACPLRGLGPTRARRILLRVQREHRERLEALVSRTLEPGAEVGRALEKGGAREVIRRALARTHADTLVLGYRGRTGLWRVLQGNLADEFLETPYLSVLAVRLARRASDAHLPQPGRRA